MTIKSSIKGFDRRTLIKGSALSVASLAITGGYPSILRATTTPIKIGIFLPYTGTYAKLGSNIKDALILKIEENGGGVSGRKVEFVNIDSEMNVSKSTERINKLILRDKVDFLVGPVHSGIGMNMARIARKSGTILIVPNAGANEITGKFCAPNIFRTSFSSWQTAYPAGKVLLEDGMKRVVLIYWNYAFGKQTADAFRESFEKGGGRIIADIPTPFPKSEFQSFFTKIAALEPDAVFTFYSGGGAIQFMKDFKRAGLNRRIKLYSTFLTEGTAKAAGDASEGIRSTLHYATTLKNSMNERFKSVFLKKTGQEADVFAVQGYDAGELIIQGLKRTGGDTVSQKRLIEAMESSKIQSPRGEITFSKAHNPIQDIYLREVINGENEMIKIAMEKVNDPALGCELI